MAWRSPCLCLLGPLLAAAAPRHPVVAELAALLQGDAQLRQAVAFTAGHVPEGQGNWSSAYPRTLDGVLSFFDDWAAAQVVPDELALRAPSWSAIPGALTFIGPMWALASMTDSSLWMREPAILAWLGRFMAARGDFMDSPASWSPQVETAWRAAINFTEFAEPAGGFKNFNSFFTRRLKSRALRPVDPSRDVLVAPCDGYAWVLDHNVKPGNNYNVKGDSLNVRGLVGYHPAIDAGDRYIGGLALCNFLAATDFHHVWSPVSGKIVAAEQLDGLYVATANPWYVSDHRRAVVVVDASEQGLGLVTMVLVGMFDISSITFSAAVVVGAHIAKGQEIGHFAYGGSEIVTLFTPEAKRRLTLDSDILDGVFSTRRQVGQRMGGVARGGLLV